MSVSPTTRRRLGALAAMLACIALGLASRRPAAVARLGLHPGDGLWAALVFCGWSLLLPDHRVRTWLTLALLGATAIEFLKGWQAPWLVAARHDPLGRLVFGQVFGWANLLAYLLGILAAAVAAWLERRRPRPGPP